MSLYEKYIPARSGLPYYETNVDSEGEKKNNYMNFVAILPLILFARSVYIHKQFFVGVWLTDELLRLVDSVW